MAEEKKRATSSGISRRGFIKGVGSGTVATGLLTDFQQDVEAAEGPQLRGPGEIPITLNINGKNKRLNVEPRVTLLDALRNHLDLTGSKKVCDRGTCGACTVMVDGELAYSCSMLAVEAEGREITTIEGVGTPDHLNEVQEAFVKHDAQQCGFCTPGFVVACTAFVKKNPNATTDEVRAGIGGNLCRCGTYAGMIEAVVEAARKGDA